MNFLKTICSALCPYFKSSLTLTLNECDKKITLAQALVILHPWQDFLLDVLSQVISGVKLPSSNSYEVILKPLSLSESVNELLEYGH